MAWSQERIYSYIIVRTDACTSLSANNYLTWSLMKNECIYTHTHNTQETGEGVHLLVYVQSYKRTYATCQTYFKICSWYIWFLAYICWKNFNLIYMLVFILIGSLVLYIYIYINLLGCKEAIHSDLDWTMKQNIMPWSLINAAKSTWLLSFFMILAFVCLIHMWSYCCNFVLVSKHINIRYHNFLMR